MKKLTTWAKSHKIAAIFAGTGALIVAGFVLIMALGIIFVSTGMVEPEPVAQETEAPKAEKKPEKTTAPKVEKKAEAKPEKKAEKPSPKAKETKPSPKKAEPKKTAEKATPKAKVDPLSHRLKETQKDLNVWFEDCEWENDEFTNGIADYATSVCTSKNIGIVSTTSDAAAKSFLTGAAEEAPIGKYFIDNGIAVWSTNGGTLNQAWDALGAPGYPKDMADLAN